MGPFKANSVGTQAFTSGVASANRGSLSAGSQAVFTAPASNIDIIYIEFVSTAAGAAVVPVAGGASGGFPLLPGTQIELSVPADRQFLADIGLTASQAYKVTLGTDV